MNISQNYLFFPASATMEEVLEAYRTQGTFSDWMLVTERDGVHYICTFSSLLPDLTDRTPHIVHDVGRCPICTGAGPELWNETEDLVEEGLADGAILRRRVGSLPMKEL